MAGGKVVRGPCARACLQRAVLLQAACLAMLRCYYVLRSNYRQRLTMTNALQQERHLSGDGGGESGMACDSQRSSDARVCPLPPAPSCV